MSSGPTTGPRPKLSWSDLAGTRAGIWGLGREGHANLRKLLALGAEPVLVDDRPAGPVDGRPVLAREGRFLVAAFHPELTDDTRLHERFLDLVREELSVVRA